MLGSQLVVVDAEDDGEVGLAAGGGDQDLPGAGINVLGGLVAIGEDAGAFERDVDLQVLPGEFPGIADRGDADRPAADVDDSPETFTSAGKRPWTLS